MRVVSSSSTKDRMTSVTIEASEKGEDLEHLHAALNSHKWVRQNEHGELETAPAHRDPPLLYDKSIDYIWDGEPAKLRMLCKPKKDDLGDHKDRAFYIQSIAGYSGERDLKAQKLIMSGFKPLRSKRGARDGLCWEIWYLPGAWAAEGEIRGKSEDEIKEWVFRYIKPGNLELSGEAWGLAIE